MKKTLFTILACTLSLNVANAQDKPTLPARAAEIIQELYARNIDGANGNDDQRRSLTEKINQQIACEFAGQGYSWKSADPGRPPSKDSVARTVNGRFYGWDWQDGTTRRPNTYPGKPADHDITGQHPIAVPCVNHLGNSPAPTPVPVPDPAPGAGDEQIAALYAEFQAFKLEVNYRWTMEELNAALLAEAVAGVRTSLEGHREEARKAKGAVLGFLTNWKNLVTIAGTALATFGVTK